MVQNFQYIMKLVLRNYLDWNKHFEKIKGEVKRNIIYFGNYKIALILNLPKTVEEK
jgi:hypothetical protein